jgi:hypothetical protein
MVIVGMMSFPPESVKEMSERFMTSPPVPSFMVMKGPYINSDLGSGFKAMILYEFDKSKMREAGEVVINRYSKFIGVPGFTFSMQYWLEMTD